MFFSRLDREEFEALKKDLFFFSGQLGRLEKRIEDLEALDDRYFAQFMAQSDRLDKLERKAKPVKKGKR